jgi:hypothetical protein
MSDYDHDTDDTEPTMVDPFAVVIELCHVAANPKAAEAVLKKLRRANSAAAAAEQRCAVAAAKLEQREAELAARAAALDVREAAIAEREAGIESSLADARDELVEREQNIARLETAWHNLGEPADVLSGFRSPEYSPLQKARMAHGQQPGKDPDRLLFAEPDAAPAAQIDALIRRDVGDARSDAQGNAFAPSTLTRSTEHKRGAV